MLSFSNCNCLLQNEQTCHCIKILWILLSYISFAFCLDAFSNFETCCNLKCFALLQYAICNMTEGRGSPRACGCVYVAPTFFFIITVKNRQNPWHTQLQNINRQVVITAVRRTRRTKRIFHPHLSPCNVPYCAPGTMIATAVTSSS